MERKSQQSTAAEEFHRERQAALQEAIARGGINFFIKGLEGNEPELRLIVSGPWVRNIGMPIAIILDLDSLNVRVDQLDVPETPYEMLITEKRASEKKERILQIAKNIPAFLRNLGFEKVPPIRVFESLRDFSNNQPPLVNIDSTRRGRKPKPVTV